MFEKVKLAGVGRQGHLSSQNRTGSVGLLADTPDLPKQEEGRMNVKYAIFCLAVAIAIFIGNELAKHALCLTIVPSSFRIASDKVCTIGLSHSRGSLQYTNNRAVGTGRFR